eukprot:734393-Pleurochrysis_carterae.AAC.2
MQKQLQERSRPHAQTALFVLAEGGHAECIHGQKFYEPTTCIDGMCGQKSVWGALQKRCVWAVACVHACMSIFP